MSGLFRRQEVEQGHRLHETCALARADPSPRMRWVFVFADFLVVLKFFGLFGFARRRYRR